jgi:Flp pilus assembly protein TadG
MLRQLIGCRRGSAAMAFSIAAIPAIGLAGLGTEAGLWYATQRHAQNAADAAAYSGALWVANPDTQTVAYRGAQFAAQNGFCNAGAISYPGARCPTLAAGTTQTVTINQGNYAGGVFTVAAGGSAVQAIASQSQPPLLASLFQTGNVTISAKAVALVKKLSNPCALALTGSITFHDNGIGLNAPSCGLVSDSTAANAIDVNNQQTGLNVGSLSASGGCTGDVTVCQASLSYEPAVPDPLAALNTAINGLTLPNCTGTAPQAYTAASKCANKNFSTNTPVSLASGTYFFSGNLKLTGNGALNTVTGGATTIILLPGASLSMTGTSTLSLIAQTTVPTSQLPVALQPYAGLLGGVSLFDPETGSPTITGNNTNTAYGIMYLPNAAVTFAGNSSVTTSCMEIIAASIEFSGASNLVNSGCPAAIIPVAQIVQLVQ